MSSAELAYLLCARVRQGVITRGFKVQNTVWTELVKKVLDDEGTRLGYEVLCRGIQDSHEWMLDVIWWKTYREESIGIALAVESEWKTPVREVIDDFQKLLCVKAPLKLLVYDGGNLPEHGAAVRSEIMAEMMRYHHHVKGETYLFASFGNIGEYCHRSVIPNDGQIEPFEFELLDTGSAGARNS